MKTPWQEHVYMEVARSGFELLLLRFVIPLNPTPSLFLCLPPPPPIPLPLVLPFD